MFNYFIILGIFLVYFILLFGIAIYAERKASKGINIGNNAVVYSLTLTVFLTTWTFYGSVGVAAKSGMLFLTPYLGPTLTLFLWWFFLRKIINLKNSFRITSIADFISVRYDKSNTVAAIITIISFIGIAPYISIQLKSIVTTFDIITSPLAPNVVSSPNIFTESIIMILIIVFIIIFGVRRLDPTERHQGVMVAIAAASIIKLIAFLIVGIFVTYFLYDGFQDIFTKWDSQSLISLSPISGSDQITWITQIILGMSAIMFLPRQFHVSVIENFDLKHLKTAIWMLPLYMFLITIFVLPIALGGLLSGFSIQQADTFVLSIPLNSGYKWISLIVFLGGFSAGIGMILVSTMTMSTMITNHLIFPLFTKFNSLGFMKKYLLQCRWFVVTIYILICYMFYIYVSDKFTLVNIGFISFAAVIQFVPAIIGGLYWRKGNKIGAIFGLSGGFLLWFYTLIIPALSLSGILSSDILKYGPWGIGFLNPEHIFGINGLDQLSHSVFWSLIVNIGLYVLGSLVSDQSKEEKIISELYFNALQTTDESKIRMSTIEYIDLPEKNREMQLLLEEYFNTEKAEEIIIKVLLDLGFSKKPRITIAELIEFHKEIELYLSGSIGAAAAHKAVKDGAQFSREEEKYLTDFYSEILSNLRLKPSDLKEKIDYYQEREKILTKQSFDLEEKVKERDREISERIKIESVLNKTNRTLRILIESNHAIVHADNETALLNTICNLLIDAGNYYMAWIGLLDDGTSIKQIVSAGHVNGFLEAILSKYNFSAFQKNPSLNAIRTKKVAISENIFMDSDNEPWMAEALKRNYYSAISLPLIHNDIVIGIISLYTDKPNKYTDEEIKLLSELANDITYGILSLRLREEHKKSEEALYKSEEKYRAMFEFSGNALIIINREKLIIRVNNKFTELSGYSSEELENKKHWSEFIASAEDLKVLESYNMDLWDNATQIPKEIEFKFIDRNNNIRDIIITVARITNSDTSLVSLLDITERNRATEAVKESQQQLAEIIDFLPDPTFVVDNDRKVIIWNTAIEEMTGTKKEDIIGEGDFAYSIPFYGERREVLIDLIFSPNRGIQKKYSSFKLKDQKFSAETYIPHAYNGKGAYLSGIAAPLYDRYGEMIGAIESLQDITDYKLAEENLKLQKEYFEQLFENTPAGIVLIDKESNIMNANKSFLTMFNFSITEIQNTKLSLILPEDSTLGKGIVDVNTKISTFAEFNFTRENITKVIIAAPAFPIRIGDKLVGTYKIYNDLTEQKRLEEQLRQSQKMEAVGTLAGGIAHDFNNILTAIMGYANLLRLKMSDVDPLKSYTDHILSSSKRAAQLTQSLLAFSRKQIINPKPVNLNEIISQFEKLLLRMIGEDIELQTLLSPEDMIVFADSGQIEQVIMNLSVNARDAMPNGGILSIHTSLVKKQFGSEYLPFAFMSISDTGSGMDNKTIQRIFEPFFTTKEQGKGTGLGLSIVYGIIKQHNGEINVYSEVGKGTSFKIYLPIVKSDILIDQDKEESHLTGGSEVILLAEDDLEVRTLMKSILEEYGYKIIEAQNGEEAINLFKEYNDDIDLLILDVIMPKMNGRQAYDSIKNIRPDIKVLFASGYTSDIIFKKGIFDGEFSFISKPATVDELLRKVRSVLEK